MIARLWRGWTARFAGPEPEVAVFYPADEGILLERETRVRHYAVVGGPDSSGGIASA